MTEAQREAAENVIYLLRSRMTFLLLCNHTLKIDLQSALSREQEEKFDQIDSVLEELRGSLKTLEKQLEPALKPKAAAGLSQLRGAV